MLSNKDRIAKMKLATISHKPYLETDRMRIAVDAYEKYKDEPVLIKRAHVFEDILNNVPVSIFEDEMIVGSMGKRANVAQLYPPESSISWLKKEIETISTRKQDSFEIDSEDIDYVLKQCELLENKTLADKIDGLIDDRAKSYIASNLFFVQKDVGYGHSLADYELVVNGGLRSLIEQANEKLKGCDDSNKDFYNAVIITSNALINYARRYANKAHELSKLEDDEDRKKELLRIEATCNRVPEYGASSFAEALQSVFFVQLAIHFESDGTGVSFGRFDQYMYPFYKKSLDAGMSKDDLYFLLQCFWIKTNNIYKCRNSKSASLWSGYIVNQNVTLGGVDVNGNDVTNDLTYMCLKAQEELNMKEPQLSLRIHDKTPDDVIRAGLDSIKKGGGKPQLVSDVTIRKALARTELTEDETYDYAIIGCVEPCVKGSFNRCKSGHINIPKIFELTLNNGFDPVLKKQVGPKTGDLSEFKTFDDFYSAFEIQLREVVDVVSTVQREATHRMLMEHLPHPFLSSLVPGCMDKGIDFTAGGAKHNWSCFTITGMANVINSMISIEQLFKDKYDFNKLLEALAHNFEGYEDLRKYLLSLPKYGNDDSVSNLMAEKVSTSVYDSSKGLHAHLDTDIFFGFVTVTKSVSMGSHAGALPDGRLAFTPYADGISPSHGTDVNGPLAILRSTEHMNLDRAIEGCILNQKYLPSFINDPRGKEGLLLATKTYLSKMRGTHVQYNVVSTETLRDAQAHPEQYRDLLVRVSGYSAYFVELSKEVQEDVIDRTEFA